MTRFESISFRIETENKARLKRLAEQSGRDQSELAREALDQFLSIQEWQIAGIERAMAQADAGDFASDRDVKAAFEKFAK